MLILISLAGVLVTVGVAVFDHDRLWHEGVMGFFVAVGFGAPVFRWHPKTWQQRTAKVLVILAVLTVVIFAVLVVLFFMAVEKNGFTG